MCQACTYMAQWLSNSMPNLKGGHIRTHTDKDQSGCSAELSHNCYASWALPFMYLLHMHRRRNQGGHGSPRFCNFSIGIWSFPYKTTLLSLCAPPRLQCRPTLLICRWSKECNMLPIYVLLVLPNSNVQHTICSSYINLITTHVHTYVF